jgi:hypothetical protein
LDNNVPLTVSCNNALPPKPTFIFALVPQAPSFDKFNHSTLSNFLCVSKAAPLGFNSQNR